MCLLLLSASSDAKIIRIFLMEKPKLPEDLKMVQLLSSRLETESQPENQAWGCRRWFVPVPADMASAPVTGFTSITSETTLQPYFWFFQRGDWHPHILFLPPHKYLLLNMCKYIFKELKA